MYIKKIVSWIVPEGIHEAKIVDATIVEHQGREQLRLIFLVTGIKHPCFKYQAKRSYDEAGGMPLRQDLTTILQEQVCDIVDDDGRILEERLDMLLGKRVRIEVVHVRNDRFEHPYCRVQAIFPQLAIETPALKRKV